MKKPMIPVIILGLILIVLSLYWWKGRDERLVVYGEVEGAVYSQISEVAGKIIEMPVALGEPVQAGALIARIDRTDQEYALEQQRIILEKKRISLRDLQNGAEPEQLEQARNNISIAEANYHSAEINYNQAWTDTETYTQLWQAGGLAQNELDKAKVRMETAAATLETAKNQVENSRQQLLLLQKGAGEAAIALAMADIAQTESQIRQMEANLDKFLISASCDGIVISKHYALGSMVGAGYNLADISAEQEKYVVCYLPQESIHLITYEQLLTVESPGGEYQGTVRYIDVKSQYTPKDMQTSANKNKISVKVKILLPPETPLKPGEKVEVVVTPSEGEASLDTTD